MDTTVTFDSFQLIIGLYFLYVTFKGNGTMYNFFDIPEKLQAKVRLRLRLMYGICALLALSEAGFCMWAASSGQTAFSVKAVTNISSAMTVCIILILAGAFVWLRKLANKK